jgi:hypothetical protein
MVQQEGLGQFKKKHLNGTRTRDILACSSLWLFLFAAQLKEFFLDGLKKLEQRSHKCVGLRREYVE